MSLLDKSATFHAPNNAVNLGISFCVGRVAGSYKFFQARISIVVNEYKDQLQVPDSLKCGRNGFATKVFNLTTKGLLHTTFMDLK